MLYCGKSDMGRKRSTNQDCFVAIELREDILLSVVCDGMGGAAGGNIAAETASKVFSGYITDNTLRIEQDMFGGSVKPDISAVLTEAASEANYAVYAMANENPELTGMGTTLISALICGNTAYIVNVGDSRLYTLTDSEIKKVTRDHSFVQYLVDMGQLTPEEAEKSPHRNIMTRAIGIDKTVESDIYTVTLSAGDIRYILLCSDGLTNYVTGEKIHTVLSSGSSEEDRTALEDKVTSLISLANKAGGGDNITALVVNVKN
ncbi:MAG: Stp1/IreP family PP2C-type Ser/Thr phosphatase [Eubacteriales bacterium]